MSQCFLFRDLIQNAIQEGRLKFGEKPRSQMKIDSDPLQVADAHYIEPNDVNMVEVTDDFNNTINMAKIIEDFVNKAVMVRVSEYLDQKFLKNFVQEAAESFVNGTTDGFDPGVTEDSNLMMVTKETADSFIQIDKAAECLQMIFHNLGITEDVNMEVNMIEVTQETSMEVDDERQQEEYNKLAFLKEEENLMDFFHRCQGNKSEVMLCPRCSVVFDKKAAYNLEGTRKAKDRWDHGAPQEQRVCGTRRAFDPMRYLDPSRTLVKLDGTRRRGPITKFISFKPTAKASDEKWVKPADGRKHGQGKWKNFEVDRGSSLAYRKEFQASKKPTYIFENYKGKNLMTESQWRRE